MKIKRLKAAGFRPIDIANACGVTQPLVNKWGESIPEKYRLLVLKAIMKEQKKRGVIIAKWRE